MMLTFPYKKRGNARDSFPSFFCMIFWGEDGDFQGFLLAWEQSKTIEPLLYFNAHTDARLF